MNSITFELNEKDKKNAKILWKYVENNTPFKILERGLEYFKTSCVERVFKIGEGNYFAYVMGSTRYEVIANVRGKNVHMECDCPYDYSEVCKHKVAVAFLLTGKECEELPEQLEVDEQADEDLNGALDYIENFALGSCRGHRGTIEKGYSRLRGLNIDMNSVSNETLKRYRRVMAKIKEFV